MDQLIANIKNKAQNTQMHLKLSVNEQIFSDFRKWFQSTPSADAKILITDVKPFTDGYICHITKEKPCHLFFNKIIFDIQIFINGLNMARQNYATLQAKIQKEIEKLRKQAQSLQSKRRKPIIQSIVRSMKEYDITIEEISSALGKAPNNKAKSAPKSKAPASARKTVAPKYRNPATGDTWTGRGKAPRWVVDAEASGQSRDQFLIKSWNIFSVIGLHQEAFFIGADYSLESLAWYCLPSLE